MEMEGKAYVLSVF